MDNQEAKKLYAKIERKCWPCSRLVKPNEQIHVYSNGSIHMRSNCPECGAFLGAIGYSDSYLIKALLNDAIANNRIEVKRSEF